MNEDAAALAKLRLEELLAFFGFNVNAKVEETERGFDLTVEVPDSGRLIGYRGDNLQAIQYLVSQMVQTQLGERIRLVIDISGYRKARMEEIASRVQQIAAQVIDSGESKMLRPMNPAERRIVHVTLAEVDGVTTESVGEGTHRRVVIKKT